MENSAWKIQHGIALGLQQQTGWLCARSFMQLKSMEKACLFLTLVNTHLVVPEVLLP
jgi:hypothetical protein